jgi:hypothetical protein
MRFIFINRERYRDGRQHGSNKGTLRKFFSPAPRRHGKDETVKRSRAVINVFLFNYTFPDRGRRCAVGCAPQGFSARIERCQDIAVDFASNEMPAK